MYQGGLLTTYLPKGDWYHFYKVKNRDVLKLKQKLLKIFFKGYKMKSSGERINVQFKKNETNLVIREGSIIFRQDCHLTAFDR